MLRLWFMLRCGVSRKMRVTGAGQLLFILSHTRLVCNTPNESLRRKYTQDLPRRTLFSGFMRINTKKQAPAAEMRPKAQHIGAHHSRMPVYFIELSELQSVDLDSGAHGAGEHNAAQVNTLCGCRLCLDYGIHKHIQVLRELLGSECPDRGRQQSGSCYRLSARRSVCPL